MRKTSTACRKTVALSDDVYWYLCKRKVELRVSSLDEVLRIELIRWQHETGQSVFPCFHGENEEIQNGSET